MLTDAWICLQPAPPPPIDWPASHRRIVRPLGDPDDAPRLPRIRPPLKPPRVTAEHVLQMLRAGVPTQRAIAEQLFIDQGIIRRRLQDLLDAGLVVRLGRVSWSVVETP